MYIQRSSIRPVVCPGNAYWCGRIWDLGTRHCIRLVTLSFSRIGKHHFEFQIPNSKRWKLCCLHALASTKVHSSDGLRNFTHWSAACTFQYKQLSLKPLEHWPAYWAAGNGEKISRGAQGLSWKSWHAVDANEMTCSYWKWCKFNVAGGQSNVAEIACFLHSESSCSVPRVTLCCL